MPSKSKSFISGMPDKVVYWGGATNDGFGGRTFNQAAIEIDTKWEDKTELFIDKEGQEVRSNAVVYTTTEVERGGYLFKGTLASLASAEEVDPTIVDGAYEIRGVEVNADMKDGTTKLVKVML